MVCRSIMALSSSLYGSAGSGCARNGHAHRRL
jgi:hypothetical protein